MFFNYPKKILSDLLSHNTWKTSVINFLLLNVIYFLHNLYENRGPQLLKKSFYDQLSLYIYYIFIIMLISGFLMVFRIQCSILLFTQYLLATSIIFGTIYIADVMVHLLNYNLDFIFNLIEFVIYLWISWIFINEFSKGGKKYFVLSVMMCVFYLISILRTIILIGT